MFKHLRNYYTYKISTIDIKYNSIKFISVCEIYFIDSSGGIFVI